jgi:hypothetical protein
MVKETIRGRQPRGRMQMECVRLNRMRTCNPEERRDQGHQRVRRLQFWRRGGSMRERRRQSRRRAHRRRVSVSHTRACIRVPVRCWAVVCFVGAGYCVTHSLGSIRERQGRLQAGSSDAQPFSDPSARRKHFFLTFPVNFPLSLARYFSQVKFQEMNTHHHFIFLNFL